MEVTDYPPAKQLWHTHLTHKPLHEGIHMQPRFPVHRGHGISPAKHPFAKQLWHTLVALHSTRGYTCNPDFPWMQDTDYPPAKQLWHTHLTHKPLHEGIHMQLRFPVHRGHGISPRETTVAYMFHTWSTSTSMETPPWTPICIVTILAKCYGGIFCLGKKNHKFALSLFLQNAMVEFSV